MEEELTKNIQLRNNEYFRKQPEQDHLYKQGKRNHKFKNIIKRILDTDNIRLAYRNIKGNKGRNSKGISGKTINFISRMVLWKYLELVKRSIKNYRPGIIRRVGIPKANGKIRYLGVKEPLDKIIEQAVLQILEPILIAKFHNNSNGFIKGRSARRAISQMISYVLKEKLYYVVDIDIKGFFDNINHGKLLKQLWYLGIRDKNLLSIISKMLKAEVFNQGIQEKGTPQGGILSPLLANVVLNELDWWLESKKKKGIRFIRYADDFKILCPTYSIARNMLEKTTKYLNQRLKLEISPEKTKIVNLKRNYSEFLGIKIKIKKHKNKYKYKITSHIADKTIQRIDDKVKKTTHTIKKMRSKPKQLKKVIENYNSYVIGIHNYYEMVTNISEDMNKINRKSLKYLNKNLKGYIISKNKWESTYITEKYCKNGEYIFGINNTPIIPIGKITHNFKLYKSNKINYFIEESRKTFHKELGIPNEFIIDKLLEMTIDNKSVEFNDNIIPVFCGQYGKFKITNNLILDYNNINIIKIITKNSDKYDNIMIVNNKVKKLLEIKGDDFIENIRLKKGLNKIQLDKINEIRKENNLPII